MLKYKNRKIYYTIHGDDMVLATNIEPKRFAAFEAHIKKKFGGVPGLGEVKKEWLFFDEH